MPRIRLDKLVKRFGPVDILHGIDLEMADCEFTVLVGPSGCGKSTTLRLIAGLEAVSDGEIYIDDRPVSHLEPKDRDLAMVFQDYALYPHMTVARNISFALRLQRRPAAEIEARVRAVAEVVGLSPFLHRKPAALSGGQRQRVAMARALAKDSSIFLFDEPLSNLDANLRRHMRAELALMRTRVRKTMVYVTHDQVEAMTLGDRIVVMQGGHIQQQGTPQAVFRHPVNRFVAGFFGTPPMNFLDGEITQRGDAVFVRGDGFDVRLPDDKAAAARAHGRRGVVLGIRPSDLAQDPAAAPDRALRLDVLMSDYVGAQSNLVCRCGAAQVTVGIPAEQPVALNDRLLFAVTPERIHLFDRESDVAI